MSLQLNNQNDGYYDSVFLLDSTTFLFNEVRDLIAAGGGGGGGSGGVVQSAILPLSITNGVLSTLFKPTNVTSGANSGIVLLQNDATGTLNIQCNGSEERASVKLTDTNSTVRLLTSNTTGNLLWNGVIVPDMNIIGQSLGNYVQLAYLTSQLALKQNTLTAGTNITITGNTISSTATSQNTILQVDGVTQSGVTTLNFIGNVSNYSAATGTLHLQSGLTAIDQTASTATTNTLITIGTSTVPADLKVNGAIILSDSNNVDRSLQANTIGNLLWNGVIVPDMNIIGQKSW